MNTVAVAVLLVHCVSAHMTKQHIKEAVDGERLFSGSSLVPIQADSPDA